ncbi:hypothetical protein Peur_062642 [Populus x canadensis]
MGYNLIKAKTQEKSSCLESSNDRNHQVSQKLIKSLSYLGIPNPKAFLIIEIDASNIGYGGIVKQKVQNHERVVWYHSDI